MLTREVLRLRGVVSREVPWDVMPDLYFYRDPEETEKEEQVVEVAKGGKDEYVPEYNPTEGYAPPEISDWATEAAAVPVQPGGYKPEDWSAAPETVGEWAAPPAAGAQEWGGVQDSWT